MSDKELVEELSTRLRRIRSYVDRLDHNIHIPTQTVKNVISDMCFGYEPCTRPRRTVNIKQ